MEMRKTGKGNVSKEWRRKGRERRGAGANLKLMKLYERSDSNFMKEKGSRAENGKLEEEEVEEENKAYEKQESL